MMHKLPTKIYYIQINDYEAAWPVAFFYDKKEAEEYCNNSIVLDKSRFELGKKVVEAKIK